MPASICLTRFRYPVHRRRIRTPTISLAPGATQSASFGRRTGRRCRKRIAGRREEFVNRATLALCYHRHWEANGKSVAIEGGEERNFGFENARRVLRIRNYRLYTAGNAVSLIGTWMQRISVGWLAWELTHSTLWLGVVAAADLVCTLALSPFAGAIADRVDRVRLLWATQAVAMAQAALLAALTYGGVVTIATLFLLSLLVGAANAVNQPARLALVPSLVDRASLPAANAVSALVFNLARFVGPAAAGLAIEGGGVGLAFALNALSYVVFMAALAGIRLPLGASAPAPRPRALIAETLAGYGYALRHPGIGRTIMLFTVTAFTMRGFIELFPGFADAVFAAGPRGLGGLTAGIGLGALMGGLWMARRPGIKGLTGLFIGHTLLAALAVLGFVLTANYWVALAAVLVCGFSQATTGISAQTLLQTAVDPAMRGRVMGLYGMLFRGGLAVNAVLLGWVSSYAGLRLAVGGGAVLCLLYWFWARFHQSGIAAALETDARGTFAP
jgi:MFS family permease